MTIPNSPLPGTFISNLPVAISLDGSEEVPLNQGGTTKRTTVADISTFPASGASFVMATSTPSLTGSRLLAAESGVTTVTDGGALGNITVGVATNGIGNTQLRQGAALSVIGNSTNATANVADIAGTAGQILRVNNAGSSLGFGTIDLSNSASVGANTLTLAGPLATAGAFSSTFTMTGATNVTFPTSGTLATTAGPSLPAVVQGDLLYGSAANVLSALAKNTSATRYLSNTGATNNPAWAQVDLTNGVTGTLPATSGGTGQPLYAVGDILYADTTTSLARLADVATGNALLSGGIGAAPAWGKVTASEITAAALTKADDTNVTLTLGGSPSTALVNAASITAGWTGQLGLTRGGTAASLTASNGGLVYSTASALAILAGTATANQIPLSGSSTTPSWSTATYPSTTAAGTILASASANTIAGTATPTLGANGGTGGQITLNGSTSGSVAIRVAAAAGSGTIFQLPADNGTNTYVLSTDGSGNTSWVASAGGGTVTSVAAGTGMSFSTITTTGSVAIDKASAANYYAATSNKVVTTDIIYPSEVAVTYGTTTTFDFATFNNASVTLTGDITTMTFSNITAGKAGTIRFIQDGSGNHTTVWNSNLKWIGGVAPTLSTAAGTVDILSYQTNTTSFIFATLAKGVA